jgi:hypothetical protein
MDDGGAYAQLAYFAQGIVARRAKSSLPHRQPRGRLPDAPQPAGRVERSRSRAGRPDIPRAREPVSRLTSQDP